MGFGNHREGAKSVTTQCKCSEISLFWVILLWHVTYIVYLKIYKFIFEVRTSLVLNLNVERWTSKKEMDAWCARFKNWPVYRLPGGSKALLGGSWGPAAAFKQHWQSFFFAISYRSENGYITTQPWRFALCRLWLACLRPPISLAYNH